MSSVVQKKWVFWLVLSAFLGWDWVNSPLPDLRQEPPLLAAGSGQTSTGAHCALAR
jgi:hypothetical protein